MIYTGKVMTDSSSCPTRRVRAAPWKFQRLQPSSGCLRCCDRATGPGDAATGQDAMSASTQAETLTEHAVNVVESVRSFPQLCSQPQKSCRADFAS